MNSFNNSLLLNNLDDYLMQNIDFNKLEVKYWYFMIIQNMKIYYENLFGIETFLMIYNSLVFIILKLIIKRVNQLKFSIQFILEIISQYYFHI